MTRASVSDRFDAVVDVAGTRLGRQVLYGIIKCTWHAHEGRLSLLPAQPLCHDTRDATTPHRLSPGSDFVVWRDATDVAVLGAAHPQRPDAAAEPAGRVVVQVGERSIAISVFGRRLMLWEPNGRPRIGPADRCDEVPLTLSSAYGGTDPRVALALADLGALLDHAGTYPRNPHGSGYITRGASAAPTNAVELPRLERADDRLTDERLLADPDRWWLQPRPAFVGFVPPHVFPRSALAGLLPARAPTSAGELAGLAEELAADVDVATLGSSRQIHPRFVQEAVPELTFDALSVGTPVFVDGCRPDRQRLAFAVPPAPAVTLSLAGERIAADPTLASVTIAPEAATVCTVWVVRSRPLPRLFVRGIHREVPAHVVVDGIPIAHQWSGPHGTNAP